MQNISCRTIAKTVIRLALENKARRCRAAVWSVRSCEASFDNAFQRYYLTNNVLLDQNKIKRSRISPAKPVITHQHKRRVK